MSANTSPLVTFFIYKHTLNVIFQAIKVQHNIIIIKFGTIHLRRGNFLREIGVSGTVEDLPLARTLAKTAEVGDRVSDFLASEGPPVKCV